MGADNARHAMGVDESKYPYDPADDWYDMDIISKTEKCAVCGAGICFYASGHAACSNDKCESHHIKIDC